MKILTQSNQIIIEKTGSNFKKLNIYFISPVRAGLRGFVIILLIIYCTHLFSYAAGLNKNLNLDFIDFLLAGMGFLLKFSQNVIQNLRR